MFTFCNHESAYLQKIKEAQTQNIWILLVVIGW